MKQEIIKELLNGMSITHFLAMYIIAISGVLVFFLIEIIKGLKYNLLTPKKFDLKVLLITSGIRMLLGAILIAVAIVYFNEIFNFFLGHQLDVLDARIDVTGGIAFIIGISIDKLIDGVISYTRESNKIIKERIKK